MNEFPGPGQQPAGNPRGGMSRAARSAAIRDAQRRPDARRAAASAGGTPGWVRVGEDAGMRSAVSGVLRQDEELFRALVGLDSGARKVPDVQDADFTLSAGGGFVVDSPALPQIAV